MYPADKAKTAFCVPNGLYQSDWLMLQTTFQRLIDTVLRRLNWKQCLVYFNDILVFSRGFEKHLKDLEDVFKDLLTVFIKLGIWKCRFGFDEIVFLGHLVTQFGIKPDKIRTIMLLAAPTNVTEVRSFLGMVNYYKKLVVTPTHFRP